MPQHDDCSLPACKKIITSYIFIVALFSSRYVCTVPASQETDDFVYNNFRCSSLLLIGA